MSDDTPDPMVTVRIVKPADPPGIAHYGICLRSTAARLAADAEADDGTEITDLGPAMALCARYENPQRRAWLGHGLMTLGVAHGGRWLVWTLRGFPAEPVPGSRASGASRN
jgi:hypothetical protein